MSQAKVDRYKKEKKNRSKTLRRKKVQKVVWVIILAAAIGAAIGVPLGRKLYDRYQEIQAENATINVEAFDYWFDNNWQRNYGDLNLFETTASDTDALLDDTGSDTEATSTDAQ